MQYSILESDTNAQKQIKSRLNIRHWTKNKLAIITGLTKSTVYDLFKEGHNPEDATLEVIADALMTTKEDLRMPPGTVLSLSEPEQEILYLMEAMNSEQVDRLIHFARFEIWEGGEQEKKMA